MTDKETLLQLEEKAWHVAPLTADLTTITNVVADDWFAVGPTGETLNKSDLLETVSNYKGVFDSLNYSNVEVNVFENTAVVISLFEGTGKEFNLTQRFMRVYAKRNNEWNCVATQIVPIPSSPISPLPSPNS